MQTDRPPGQTAERWTRLECLFHAVIDLDPAERARYLDAQGVDAELRKEVEGLVSASRKTGTGISDQIGEQAESIRSAAAELQAGEALDVWRIVRKLAEGGMGAVYLAERADAQFQQTVAIKLLRANLSSPALAERFRQERQLLASLTHPNVARLYGGGTTARGMPYLVMEYVEGPSLDRWCESLRIPERLRLFQKLCAAVQAAHQNLIVHRDIKPSNVLVGKDGEPKLLDFGIAKPVADEAAEPGTQTVLGQRMFTPEFASPEQIRGERVTTASDVYSLGVTLYVLLAGCSPYERWRTTPLDLQRAICETDPQRPSLAVTGSGSTRPKPELGRQMRDDLDHIVMMAMRKEPGLRYASPAALAEDIQRFVDGLPITARAGSRRYRWGKFLRRNALSLSAAAGVLITITALVVFYTQRLRTERDTAETERAAAEQTAQFMVSLFDNANPNRARPDLLARDVLQSGAARVETELADQPLIAARLLMSIGRAYWAMALYEDGEQRMRRALELGRAKLPSDDLQLAELVREFGMSMLERERYEDGERLANEALAIYQRRLGPDAMRVADQLLEIQYIVSQRDHDTSEVSRQRLRNILRIYQLHGAGQSLDAADVYGLLSTWHKQRFEWNLALPAIEKRIEIYRAVSGDDHLYTAVARMDLARLHYFMGDYTAAKAAFERVLSTMEAFKGPMHNQLGWPLYFLARIERERGEHAHARALLERLIAIEEDTPQSADRRYLARALCGHALVLADAGEFERAESQCRRGQDILRASQQQRVQLDVAHEGLGIVALARGDLDTALRELAALAAIRRREHDPAQTDTPRAIALHASALAASGDSAAAETLFAEALRLAEQRYVADYPGIGYIVQARAYLRASQGHPQAESDRKRAAAIFERRGVVAQTERWTIPPRGQTSP